MMCPFPAYNQEALESHGYANSFDYTRGINVKKDLVGWTGSGEDVSTTLDNISLLNKPKHCPYTTALFLDQRGKVKKIRLSMKLTRAFFPTGRCCQAIVPEISKNSTIRALTFSTKLKYNIPTIESYKLILTDQTSTTEYHINQLNIYGTPLKANIDQLGYSLQKLMVHEKQHLEKIPKLQCRNYDQVGSYDKVY